MYKLHLLFCNNRIFHLTNYAKYEEVYDEKRYQYLVVSKRHIKEQLRIGKKKPNLRGGSSTGRDKRGFAGIYKKDLLEVKRQAEESGIELYSIASGLHLQYVQRNGQKLR